MITRRRNLLNPHVATSWITILFSLCLTIVVGIGLWRKFRPLENLPALAGFIAVLVALSSSAVADLFYHGILPTRVWPATGIFDQVIVTSGGDILAKVQDPVMVRNQRVQRYDCRGNFKNAYQTDNRGGVFKIAANTDGTLSIFSARGDTVDVFRLDGAFIDRRTIDPRDMPLDLLRSGPSVTKLGDCSVLVDPVSGGPAVWIGDEIRPLERGDWFLETVLSGYWIVGLALSGCGILALSLFKRRNEPPVGRG